jgi:hypothetical protein
MSESFRLGSSHFRTLANGLFPSGFAADALTPEGRDEVREAVEIILKLWDHRNARLTLVLEQLDKAAREIERLNRLLIEQSKLGEYALDVPTRKRT